MVPSQNHIHATSTPKGYEAIILAGGLGTRLRSVVSDLPKCMAPVAGKPFLHYVITQLLQQGVDKFIFSLGYMSEAIEAFLLKDFSSLSYKIVIEKNPLGTGGAIHLACQNATNENVLVLNGDTLFVVDIAGLHLFHQQKKAACTLSLKPMKNVDRYCVVELNAESKVMTFKEKKFYTQGLINGGVYMINCHLFSSKQFPEKFSFEKDYLEKFVGDGSFFGIEQHGYFIDIGIPEDFEKAQLEFVGK